MQKILAEYEVTEEDYVMASSQYRNVALQPMGLVNMKTSAVMMIRRSMISWLRPV